MALDTTVMNTAIATVADDLGTTVTGIQTAITLYTLVMASLMITGGKLGEIIGRKRAFSIGCIIYACGSLTTSLSPNLTVLMIGWSLLEGLGAVLIMPAIVALVAANFGRSERPRAYGLVAAAGAMRGGPRAGRSAARSRPTPRGAGCSPARSSSSSGSSSSPGGSTTRPPEQDVHLDVGGTALSALGLGLDRARRSSSPGPGASSSRKPEAPTMLRALAGDLDAPGRRRRAGALPRLGEPARRARAGRSDRPRDAAQPPAPQRRHLVPVHVPRPGGAVLRGAAVPLGRPRPVGDRDRRAAAAALAHAARSSRSGFRSCSPTSRRAGWSGSASSCLFAGLVLLVGLLDVGAGAEIVTWPLLLAGAGLGALASQLGSVTVSAVPDEQSGEVGGLQNTGTQLGASIGTALAGAMLISALDRVVLHRHPDEPRRPRRRRRPGRDRARRRRPVRLRRRTRGRPRRRRRPAADRRRRRRRERAEPHRRSASRARGPRDARPRRARVHPRHPRDPARQPVEAGSGHLTAADPASAAQAARFRLTMKPQPGDERGCGRA